MTISIVTVSMNRTEHLLQQAQAVSDLHDHSEHIILDFGSTIPISRTQLPHDERIQLHRVESANQRWWLTHSYNLAFALARGDYILKLDADILPSRHFTDKLCKQQAATDADLMCNRLTLQDWSLPSKLFTSNGMFFCKRSCLAEIGGFNPYLRDWGWDEIDLYSRFFLAGFSASRMPQEGLRLIQHDNALRVNPIPVGLPERDIPIAMSRLNRVDAGRRMMAQNEKNKQIAVASINKHINWPRFEEYLTAFRESSCLPPLPTVALFNAQERHSLEAKLRWLLLRPSYIENMLWRLARKLGFGPYTYSNTQSLLACCNIDLDLVA